MPAGEAANSAAAAGNEGGGENIAAVIASFCARNWLHQRTPRVGVLHRIAGYLGDSLFNIAMDADEVAIGKRMRKRNLRLDEFVAIKQSQLIRNR